jgi:hypothetical protein
MNSAPMLRAANLWEKTSARGNTYYVGRLGGVKIVILANRDRENNNAPTHHLYFAEPNTDRSRPAEPQPAKPQRAAPRRRAYPRLATERTASGPPLPDDELGDLWRDGDEP